MSRTCVHESELISVWCDPVLRLVHHQIHRYCHSEPFRTALSAGTDALIVHRCTAWLSDDRLNGPLTPEDGEWARKHWFPRTQAAGWTHWAMVKPERVVAQLNVQQFTDEYAEKGIQVAIFSEPEAAFEWLREARAA